MIWIDYCILGIIGLSVAVGALRGLVRDLLGLGSWLLAFGAAYWGGQTVSVMLAPYIPVPGLRIVAGYGICFFVALLFGAVLTQLFHLLVRDSALAAVDRTLGAAFGLLRGVFIVVAILTAAGTAATAPDHWWRGSILVPPLVPLADILRDIVPENWLAYVRPPAVQQLAAPVPAKGK